MVKQMNKHKSNWSVMGIEADTEPSALQELRQKHKNQLINMMSQYNQDGFNEVVKILREIKENQ